MDLKEFWDKLIDDSTKETYDSFGITDINSMKYLLGMFFWERGGKHFMEIERVGYNPTDDFCIAVKLAEKSVFEGYSSSVSASDFLDCLACLGEEKVKELIKELK